MARKNKDVLKGVGCFSSGLSLPVKLFQIPMLSCFFSDAVRTRPCFSAPLH
jgi:hypothetical protein